MEDGFKHHLWPLRISHNGIWTVQRPSSVIQAFMNDILMVMLGKLVIVFIDDIMIYSCSFEEHNQHVKKILQKHQVMTPPNRVEPCHSPG